MDRIFINQSFHPTVTFVGVYGKGDSVPVDQQPCKDFNIDPATGRPMSDISAVLRANKLDQQRLLAEMTEFKADYLPSDISDVDALKYAVPRLAQLPSELAEYSEALTSARLEEAKESQRLKDLEEFKKSLSDSTVVEPNTDDK